MKKGYTKGLFSSTIFLCPVLCIFFSLCLQPAAYGQYADLGTGSHKNRLWWFNWAGFTPQNGAVKTFITPDGLEVTVAFSNLTGPVPQPSSMNTWTGAVLHLLYNFTNASVRPALYTPHTNSNTALRLTITARRGGVPTPFSLVAADSEASDGLEDIVLTTNGSPWKTIEVFKNSMQTNNPVQGCHTSKATISNTYAGGVQRGQNPLLFSQSTSLPLTVDLQFVRRSWGRTGIAFGLFLPFDRGDHPPSFGFAHHAIGYTFLNACSYPAPLPEAVPSKALHLGNMAGDADRNESGDDNLEGADEEALSGFPTYDRSGTYELTMPVVNTTGLKAFIAGWFDFDQNGIFTTAEKALSPLPNGATTASLKWEGLPLTVGNGATSGVFSFRFRLTTDSLSLSTPAGASPDGEVEDYFPTLLMPCIATVRATNDVSVCKNSPVTLAASGVEHYSWTPAAALSNATVSNPTARPVATTMYIVQGTDGKGCFSFDTVNVLVHPLPLVARSPDTALCGGGAVALRAAGGVGYEWSPASTLSNPSDASTTAMVSASSTFVVRVTDENNCTNVDSVKVFVQKIGPAGTLHIPSAFTPNGDGKNDCFGLTQWGETLDLQFSIYNRWGERVFSSNNYRICWDGTYRGQAQPEGVYVYLIHAKSGCAGQFTRRGYVTLMR